MQATTTKTRAPKTTAPAKLADQTTQAAEAAQADQEASQAAKVAAELAAWVEAMRTDWLAEKAAGAFLGSFEEYLDKQRVDPKDRRYTGRMLALVAARKSYVRGKNGNQHTGDFIGTCFEVLPREQVVETCVEILSLPGNPYPRLNPGQQSMNLRNRVRGALQRGEITVEQIKAAIAKRT